MIHGILNVYKEKGYTSHDVVAKLRGITGQKKIGHTGTLDPDAVGVLPVCLGKGTKVCSLLTDENKTYEAVMLLGKVTDTQDISGKVLSERPVDASEDEVRETVLSFQGEYDQIPPMYSAVKVQGKKLYELARRGQEVERETRRVEICGAEILEMALPEVRMSVTCSKGTYIRTLCHDIGEKLGCGGCMEELCRTRVGRFHIEDALTLGEIEGLAQAGNLAARVVPVDAMFPEYCKAQIRKSWELYAKNGNPLPQEALEERRDETGGGKIRLYDSEGQFIALYKWEETEETYRLEKMFFPEK